MDYAIDTPSAERVDAAGGAASSATGASASSWLVEPGQNPSTFVRPTKLAIDANVSSNRSAPEEVAERWKPVRDALWEIIDSLIPDGGRVGIVGAGNGHDLPLPEIAERASRVDLIDVDRRAVMGSVERLPEALRDRCSILIEDVTGGAANDIVASARDLHPPLGIEPPRGPLGTGDYDLVIGDLIYGQLIGIGLRKACVPASVRERVNATHAPGLVTALMERMHASAPGGVVVHIHDLVQWTAQYSQPYTIKQVLADPNSTLPHVHRADLVDPSAYLADISAEPNAVHYWHWPFSDTHDFVVRAVVAAAAAGTTDATGRPDGR